MVVPCIGTEREVAWYIRCLCVSVGGEMGWERDGCEAGSDRRGRAAAIRPR